MIEYFFCIQKTRLLQIFCIFNYSLESPTRSLKLEANQDIELLSSAGEIQINSLLDIHFKSKQVLST